jgi:hypothetical protein
MTWMRGRGVGLAAGLMAITLPSGLLMGGQLARLQAGPSEPHSGLRARQAGPDRSRPHWCRPDLASVKLLRHAVAEDANRTLAAVAGCDARARADQPRDRSSGFRRCAFSSLARAGTAGGLNGRMLFSLSGQAPRECARLVRLLAGASLTLGNASQGTLRHVLGRARWPDVRAASRWIRASARIARGVAASPRWAPACVARRSADSPLAA